MTPEDRQDTYPRAPRTCRQPRGGPYGIDADGIDLSEPAGPASPVYVATQERRVTVSRYAHMTRRSANRRSSRTIRRRSCSGWGGVNRRRTRSGSYRAVGG